MGLDWNPGNRPKPGLEAELRECLTVLRDNLWQWPSLDAEARYHEISITPYETLRTPRVGYDTIADQWVETIYEPSQHGEFADFKRRMYGFYVVPLVPACDGLPKYTNGTPGGYVEPFSFRADWLDDCDEIIDQELLNSAYQSKLTDETREYGRILLERCHSFAISHGIDLESAAAVEDCGAPEFKADIVLSAAKWCLFWADKGHMLEAYY